MDTISDYNSLGAVLGRQFLTGSVSIHFLVAGSLVEEKCLALFSKRANWGVTLILRSRLDTPQ